MIEFEEFLSIIKGGSNKKEGTADDGTGAIYEFFNDLTSDKLMIDGKKNIPFSLFISSSRRRMIIQSMCGKDEKLKKDGEKILSAYKKQIADKLAREHAENQGPLSDSRGSKRSKMNGSSNTVFSSKSKQVEMEQ